MEEILKILKNSVDEKTIIQSLLLIDDTETEITRIGNVNDIDCDSKNEFFDGIYEDEKGNIIDLRIYEKKPDEDKIKKLEKYWKKLNEKFNKSIAPIIIVYGEQS
jgi:hypothetical protein